MAIRNKELSKVNRSHFKLTSYLSIYWMIAIPANTIAVKFLAVEFITLLKRVSQLISVLSLYIFRG